VITDFILPQVNFMWCGGDFIFYVQVEGSDSLSEIAADSHRVTARVLKHRLLLYGAMLLEYLNRSITHIVVPSLDNQSWHADVAQHVRYNANCTVISVEDVEQLLSGSEKVEDFHPSFRRRLEMNSF